MAPSKLTTSTFLGVYRKPSFLAQPSPLVQSGQNVTLQCCSEIVFDSFILHREGVMESPLHLVGQLHDGGSQATFLMGPVTTAHAGTYRCFGSTNYSSYEWSTPSDPLNITITGLYKKPLLTQLSPVVKAHLMCTIYPGMGRPMNIGLLEGRAIMVHSRPSSFWALRPQPTMGPIDAMALSMTLQVCGQTQVTYFTFLSQRPPFEYRHLSSSASAPSLQL
uniref:Immunoglobulin domain-containing protein n=1 Tax=Equus asinus TaxID=9793 RepID=A0A8C4MTU9_EQUAS